MNKFQRAIPAIALAIPLGWILCEALLPILVPQPIYYSSWFTADVHQPDEQLGFVFRPNYNGAMRNVDHVWFEPIQLDANGLRQPAVRSDQQSEANPPSRIVMLGGASMAFCYGLSDAECLHQRVADRLDHPCRIDLISWPGFTLAQEIHKLQRFCRPDEFDIAVVYAYGEEDFRFNANWQQLPRPAKVQMIQSVVMPNDPAASSVGDLYYRSRVIAGLCRAWRVPAGMLSRLGFVTADSVSSSTSPVDVLEDGEPPVYLAARRLIELGIPSVLIVALPRQGQLVGPQPLPDSPSSDIRVIDLRNELDLPADEAREIDWIASGHYGPRSAAILAIKISNAIAAID